MRGWAYKMRGIAFVSILVVIWGAVSKGLGTPLAPGPLAVGHALQAAVVDGTLVRAVLVSLARLLFGYGLALAAGIPLGAFLVREKFASALGTGKHGTTFGGGPLACRAALEYLAVIEDEKLLERVCQVGGYLNGELKALAGKSKIAREVRGVGMMQALELSVPARTIVERAMAEGLLINSTQETVLRFLPPFLLEEKHVDKAMRVLRKILREAAKN